MFSKLMERSAQESDEDELRWEKGNLIIKARRDRESIWHDGSEISKDVVK